MDLAAIAGWARRWLGDGIVLAPTDGSDQWLRVRACERPLRPFAELIGGAATGPLERFATLEGELAGLVAVARGDATHCFAMIVGDDRYALVEGRARGDRAPPMRELVRTVARCYPLGLGPQRVRRYVYQPPPGWHALPRAGATCWLADGFPRASGRITVFDARPRRWQAPGAVDRFLFVDENPFADKDPPRPPVPIIGAALAGQAVRATGRGHAGTPIAVGTAVLEDERYVYLVRLDVELAAWDQFSHAWEDLVRSIEPLPASAIEGSAQQFVHWIE